MCGIVGTLVFDGGSFSVSEDYLSRMRDTMAHRGPDGSGTWVRANGRIGLGHRRLSIIDLSSAAAQPMMNEDGNLRVVFNGEIYNHAEIRAELESLGGHRWRTDHSDTEVILHAFEQWGIACLRRFRGIFAFALWDEREQALWLVRDRIGVKPLYYSVHHGRITFASEIKALLADPQQQREVNEEALYHYLSFLAVPAPNTMFAGIHKLPCATWLKICADGKIEEQKYWDVLDQPESMLGISDEEISERVLAELRTAVQLRKVSDVPVGVFLSGGIDSSTNAALFAEGEAGRVHTFSIGYEGDSPSYRNELDYARLMAKRIGADHHERLLTLDDLLEFLPRMVYLQDEPIGDPVCVPVYYVSQLARDHGVTVCQVGEGADELFWGYPGWKTALRLQRLSNMPLTSLLKRLGMSWLRVTGRDDSFSYEWLRRGLKGEPVFWGGAEAFTETHKKRLLSPRLRKKFASTSSWQAIEPLWRRFKGSGKRSNLAWMTYLDLNVRLPELLLMRVDKMSMGASLEAREPFLDHVLVELAFRIPEAAMTRNGVLKCVLKRAVQGLVPDSILHRPKQGFGIPAHEWFMGRLGTRIREELADFCARTDFLDWKEVSRILDQGRAAQAWYLFNFALWWKAHVAD
jgi:asparagine synthase (glutamine-hydrolysing)